MPMTALQIIFNCFLTNNLLYNRIFVFNNDKNSELEIFIFSIVQIYSAIELEMLKIAAYKLLFIEFS